MTPDATDEQIKQAYRKLAMELHPDRHVGNPLAHLAAERLREVNEAYEVLGNPKQRAAYDRGRSAGQAHETFGGPGEAAYGGDYSGAGLHCHRHTDVPAVTTCQFCGKGLCTECAGLFTITACPECLLSNNRQYLQRLRKTIWFSVGAAFAGLLVFGGAIGGPGYFLGPLYGLGLYWGWEYMVKAIRGATYAGFFGPLVYLVVLVFALSIGWFIGMIVGIGRFIGTVREFMSFSKTSEETERFITQTMAG